MLNDIVSSIIGVLLLALSGAGGSATISATSGNVASTTATASTSIEIKNHGFLISLVNALTRYQEKLQKEDRPGKEGHDSEDGEDIEIRADDEDKDSDTGKNEDENESENEEEDENEDGDEDRGGSTNGTGSGASGTSGSGAGSAGASTSATFTLGAIASHNTSVSCYTTINGSVYDLTTWIPLHPGGQAAIKGLCGVDGTAAFNGQHGGAQKQAQILAKYKIGTLVK